MLPPKKNQQKPNSTRHYPPEINRNPIILTQEKSFVNPPRPPLANDPAACSIRMDRYIRYDSEFNLAICVTPCQCGITAGYATRHFRTHSTYPLPEFLTFRDHPIPEICCNLVSTTYHHRGGSFSFPQLRSGHSGTTVP
jgi:hypothetical protein